MICLNIQDRNIFEDSEKILSYIERIREELDEHNRMEKNREKRLNAAETKINKPTEKLRHVHLRKRR
jgi:hypothetical protein